MINEIVASLVPVGLLIAIVIGYYAHKNNWKIANIF